MSSSSKYYGVRPKRARPQKNKKAIIAIKDIRRQLLPYWSDLTVWQKKLK